MPLCLVHDQQMTQSLPSDLTVRHWVGSDDPSRVEQERVSPSLLDRVQATPELAGVEEAVVRFFRSAAVDTRPPTEEQEVDYRAALG